MAANAPYFIEFENLRKFPGPDHLEHQQPMYPELSQPSAADANMYALADGAMQAHQEHNQFANLVQAAEAAKHEAPQGLPQVESADRRKTTRKRKRQGSEEGDTVPQDVQGGSSMSMVAAATTGSALFREPSTKSVKHTRPPMSKLFQALELPPEQFLRLQSAAKSYMLDPDFTNRQETVGERGKGDSELVKLRLYECVKDFLDTQGNGERYFGEQMTGEDGSLRKMIWPRDKNAIYREVTPLLRRMVTNEHQRQYAIKSRKGGGPATKKQKMAEAPAPHQRVSNQASASSRALLLELTGRHIDEYPLTVKYIANGPQHDPTVTAQMESLRIQFGALEPEMLGILVSIDFHLRVTHRQGLSESTACSATCENAFSQRIFSVLRRANSGEHSPSASTQIASDAAHSIILLHMYRLVRDMVARTPSLSHVLDYVLPTVVPSETEAISQTVPSLGRVWLHISHVSETGARLGPRRDVLAETARYLHVVAQEAVSYAGPGAVQVGGKKTRVRVLTAGGLKEVTTDAEWRAAVEGLKAIEWMDGVVKVLVDHA